MGMADGEDIVSYRDRAMIKLFLFSAIRIGTACKLNVGDFRIDEQRTVGENHLKLRVQPAAGGSSVDAIAFNQAGPAYRGVVRLTYKLDVNEFRGRKSVQMMIEHMQPG